MTMQHGMQQEPPRIPLLTLLMAMGISPRALGENVPGDLMNRETVQFLDQGGRGNYGLAVNSAFKSVPGNAQGMAPPGTPDYSLLFWPGNWPTGNLADQSPQDPMTPIKNFLTNLLRHETYHQGHTDGLHEDRAYAYGDGTGQW